MAGLLCFAMAVSVSGCGSSNTVETPEQKQEKPSEQETISVQQQIDSCLEDMTLEEKVAQLFIIQPEAILDVSTAVAAGDATRKAINQNPVGGFIYFGDNLQSKEQTQEMLKNVQTYSMERTGFPAFLSVDEEGGTVARVAGTGNFDLPRIGDMADIGAAGDVDAAKQVGEDIGSYLAELGFNLDFAPVADVWSNPENTVIRDRSFGNDPELVSDMAIAVSDGLEEKGILSTYKHFPGHGATSADTHKGYAYTDKTLEELEACELIPFQRCIADGAKIIMAAHISVPNVTGDDTPTSLSKTMVTDILREKMGYTGLVVTDAMNMGAITEEYTSAEAAVKALQAGVDVVLMPENYQQAYQGVLDAVADGTLTEERIDESVTRILTVKLDMQ
ncbi:MAG: glycoside hydrolase family 3 N-terminal domain-containing protein [Clostridiales bacterium]|nr:glycoside hydrolase family 3 N-terminal domain-containing protein [Clostridiales bacterium]